MTKQIDIAYIVKKLTALNQKKLNLKEVSGFLAEYMHFEYTGFLINGKYYTEDERKIPAEQLTKLSQLKRPERGVWQSVSSTNEDMMNEYGISRVAILTNTNGVEIGQMIFGKPTSKTNLDRKDLAEVEMIITLMGTMIENGGRSKS